MRLALTCQHGVMSLVRSPFVGWELSTFMRAWQATNSSRPNRPMAGCDEGSHDHCVLHGQPVRDAMCDDTRATVGEEGPLGAARREEEASCKRREWKRASRCRWQQCSTGRELEEQLSRLELGLVVTLQRGAAFPPNHAV